MRYLVMHKIDVREDQHAPPSQKIMEEMGALIDGSLKSGVFVDGDGLKPSDLRARLRARGGQVVVERGPYTGQNELCSRLAQVRAASLDGAIELARRYAEALGNVDIEIGPVVEAWDLGMMPKPTGLTSERFLLLVKSDAQSEAGKPLPAEQRAALEALEVELRADKTLRTTIELAPSSRAQRLAGRPKNQRFWVDGPFAESKELISGFSLLELPSRAAAEEWANRYAAILGECEVDIREVD
jgi:hypothetical protein